jgi:anti-sigma B factor antagonist
VGRRDRHHSELLSILNAADRQKQATPAAQSPFFLDVRLTLRTPVECDETGKQRRGELSVVLKLHRKSSSIVPVEGPLRVPISRALDDDIRPLLRQGERVIVLDLAQVTRIDAAGVGELVRAFNLTAAANGRLRITNASPWVRKVLDRAGVLDLLTGEMEAGQRLA